MLEKKVEQYLTKHVKNLGGMCIKLSPQFLAGIPDRLCLLPGGRCIFVELKRPGGKPRPLQVIIANRLRKLGFTVLTLDNYKDIDTYVN